MDGRRLSSDSDGSSSSSDSCERLDPFNKMVLEISGMIGGDAFEQIKILCWGVIPIEKWENMKKPHELIFELHNQGKITRTNVRYLIKIVKQIPVYPVVNKLKVYQQRIRGSSQSLEGRRRRSLPEIDKQLGMGYFELRLSVELSPEQCLKYDSAKAMFLAKVKSILENKCREEKQLIAEAFRDHGAIIEKILYSSIIVVLVCRSRSAVICFKKGVRSGNLGDALTNILVTDEIRLLLKDTGIDPKIVISIEQSYFENAEQYFRDMQDQASLVAKIKEVEIRSRLDTSMAPLDLMVRKLPSMKSLATFRELVKVFQKKCSESRYENQRPNREQSTMKLETDDIPSSTQKLTSRAVKICDFLLELSISGRYRESMMQVKRQVGWLCPSCSHYNTPMCEWCVKCDTSCPNTYERPDDHSYLTLLEESLNEIKSGLLKEESSEDRHLSSSTGSVKGDVAGHFKHGLGEGTALEINATNKSDIHGVSSPVTVSAKPTIPALKTLFNTLEDKMYVTQLHTLRNLLSGRQIPQAVSKQFDRPSEIFEYLLVNGYLAEDDVNLLKEVFTVMDDEGLVNLVTEYERLEGLAEKVTCNLSVTEAKLTIPPYKILFDILDESMDVTQLRTLRNLLICRQIPLAASKLFNRPSEIFEYLLYVGYITEGDVYLLKEVFTVMGDEGLVNLVTEYEHREGLAEKETCNLSVTEVKPTIPPLKILFNILDENMDVSQLRTLRSLLSGRQIPQAESKQYNRPSEIFEYLLYMGSIKEGDLNLLKEVFTLMDDEKLVALVTKYKRCKGLPEN